MPAGTMPRAAQALSMDLEGRLAWQKADGIGHPLFRGKAETPRHMRGQRGTFDQCAPLLLAQVPQNAPHTSSELPIEDPAPVLWPKHSGILAVPTDVRLAWPVSPEDLLSSERGGSLQGGLLHVAARRNGRASGRLTARGGGLPCMSYLCLST